MNQTLSPRATCLNCIDGRVQLPALHWIREHYPDVCVDVVTAAGIDGALASGDNIDEALRNIGISVNTNHSTRLFIVGHYDCKGNPVDESTHHQHIIRSVEQLKKHWPELEVIGLWVDDHWQVQKIK